MRRRAVILAGGKGTRLLPYSTVLPKPLMPVGEYTILEIVIRQLVSYGFAHITLTVNHQADLIKSFFGNGDKWGVFIDYSLETRPLSTMAPLKFVADLPEKFLVMNGDILTDLNFEKFYESHTINDLFSISAYKRDVESNFGVLGINENNLLINFQEKPVFSFDVSMGIYMLSKPVLEYIPEEKFGFDDLMYLLIKKKLFPKVIKYSGYWLDIGRPDDYATATEVFESRMKDFLQ